MILDDFFTRALLAGIGMAIVAGPLGCFVIWRRLAYFGDTLAHSGLLGVTIGFILNIDLSLSVFVISGIIALLLIVLQKKTKLAGDALPRFTCTFFTCHRTCFYSNTYNDSF
tara:strand:+ start:180 stop:515 length:336 start_codon:yes stop_codon:yes gene_type:complete